MKIGIISDTHGYYDPEIDQHLNDCDEIWHLGDIGTMEVLERLESLPQKTRIVFGNIDQSEIQLRTNEHLSFVIEGLKILLIHIAGRVEKYNKQVRELVNIEKPNILVCGHSHILKVVKDQKYNLLYVNPGAVGNQGFHKIKTIIKMEIGEGKVQKMEAIELGKRGKISP